MRGVISINLRVRVFRVLFMPSLVQLSLADGQAFLVYIFTNNSAAFASDGIRWLDQEKVMRVPAGHRVSYSYIRPMTRTKYYAKPRNLRFPS